MIIFIEGPRNSGKTHLIDSFFKQNKNPDVIYYKFKFAKYIEDLDLKDQESGPGIHYFSIANVLTILELNKTLLKDKIVIFDRSIFSAYVWSIYRNRMDRERLLLEFEKILNSELFEDCVLFYLNREEGITTKTRGKDYFCTFEDYTAEKTIFDEVLTKFYKQTTDSSKRNLKVNFINGFDESSVNAFNTVLTDIIKARSSANK